MAVIVTLPIEAVHSCINPDPTPSSSTARPPRRSILFRAVLPHHRWRPHPPDDGRNDVTLLNCSRKTDSYNMTTATVNVRVVNHTDAAQFYSVDVGLSDAQGQQVATAYALAESVPAGASVTVTGTGYPSGPVPRMRLQAPDVLRVSASTGGGTGAASPLHLPHVGVPGVDLDLPHLHLGHLGHGHK